MNESERAKELAELEEIWTQRFVYQPKLPTEALLTGAVAMALGFGAVLFFLSPKMRNYAWIFVGLSIGFSIVNRLFAKRWYNKVVLPWSSERSALQARIAALREPCSDSSGNKSGGSDRA